MGSPGRREAFAPVPPGSQAPCANAIPPPASQLPPRSSPIQPPDAILPSWNSSSRSLQTRNPPRFFRFHTSPLIKHLRIQGIGRLAPLWQIYSRCCSFSAVRAGRPRQRGPVVARQRREPAGLARSAARRARQRPGQADGRALRGFARCCPQAVVGASSRRYRQGEPGGRAAAALSADSIRSPAARRYARAGIYAFRQRDSDLFDSPPHERVGRPAAQRRGLRVELVGPAGRETSSSCCNSATRKAFRRWRRHT